MSKIIPIRKTVSENTAIELKAKRVQIARAVSDGDIFTPLDIAEKFGISEDDAVALFSNDQFLEMMTAFTNAKLQINYQVGLNRVTEIIRTSQDNKEVLNAFNIIAKLNGSLKAGISVNLNIESMLNEVEQKKVTDKSTEVTSVEENEEEAIFDLFPDEEGVYE